MPTGLGTSYWVWLWQQPTWRRWLCKCCGLLVSLFSGKSVATVLSLLRDVHHSFHDALVGEFKTYSACVGLLETRLFSQKKKKPDSVAFRRPSFFPLSLLRTNHSTQLRRRRDATRSAVSQLLVKTKSKRRRRNEQIGVFGRSGRSRRFPVFLSRAVDAQTIINRLTAFLKVIKIIDFSKCDWQVQ